MGTEIDGKRVAIVTGAAKGIGRAIALNLAGKGILTVVVDIDQDAARNVATEIGKLGLETDGFVCDVSDVTEIKRCFTEVQRRFGTIDILVNNAGILSTTDITEIDEEEWQRVMDINLKSMVFTTQTALKVMIPRKWGRIINLSSLAGRMGGLSTGCAYSISKAAILGLTMRVARRVAGDGITVNAIAPGTSNTEMAQGFTPAQRKQLEQGIPVGRLIEPNCVAEAVAFLASDAAEFITGAVIDVNGGMFMG
jgi:3-oxoacyl-[acyl-carrier protein] reductase